MLMQEHQEDLAAEILSHVTFATIFQDEQAQLTLALASLCSFLLRSSIAASARTHSLAAVAMRAADHDSIVEQVRSLIRRHQFSLEALQCLPAALGSGIKAADAFTNLNLQKFLLRELKTWNASAQSDAIRWNSRGRRWILPRANGSGGDDDGTSVPIPTPNKISPVVHALYGEVLLTAKSYQSSICKPRNPFSLLAAWSRPAEPPPSDYFLRAYACNPYDPVICLLLAQAYSGRAMNRQTDNRHLHVTTVRSASVVEGGPDAG